MCCPRILTEILSRSLSLHRVVLTSFWRAELLVHEEKIDLYKNNHMWLFLLFAVGMASDFTSASNANFIRNGTQQYFMSANFWQAANLGTNEFEIQLSKELDVLSSFGVSNLRIMAASEGPDDQPYRIKPSIQPSPGFFFSF